MATFFSGLQLWEKMTFVLGCAISAVFCIGMAKLWWTGRLVKKQTGLDEEKMENEQNMKEADLLVESKKIDNVPFGVRAIESGIEIDGIWVSRSNSPIPESLRFIRTLDRNSSSSAITNSAFTINSTVSDISPPKPPSIRSMSGLENTHYQFERSISSESFPRPVSIRLSGQRHAYKPTRSSQLRFSSYGEYQYHEETLNRLEGKPRTESKSTAELSHSASPISPMMVASSSSDMGVDSEMSSGSSPESVSTVSRKERAVKHASRQFRPSYSQTAEECNQQARANASESIAVIISANDDDSFQVQNKQTCDDGGHKETSAFVAPELSDRVGHSSHSEGDPGPMSESQVPLLRKVDPSTPKASTFGSGGIHMNKAVRRINSNFELLPAGTFGFRAKLSAMTINDPSTKGPKSGLGIDKIGFTATATKRPSNKLRKKVRKSWITSLVGTPVEHV